MFDQAMELVKDKYWKGAEFSRSEIVVSYKACMKQEQPYHDYAIIHRVI